jgi:hypothetical protein
MDIQVREQIINHLLQVADQKQRVIEEQQKQIAAFQQQTAASLPKQEATRENNQ